MDRDAERNQKLLNTVAPDSFTCANAPDAYKSNAGMPIPPTTIAGVDYVPCVCGQKGVYNPLSKDPTKSCKDISKDFEIPSQTSLVPGLKKKFRIVHNCRESREHGRINRPCKDDFTIYSLAKGTCGEKLAGTTLPDSEKSLAEAAAKKIMERYRNAASCQGGGARRSRARRSRARRTRARRTRGRRTRGRRSRARTQQTRARRTRARRRSRAEHVEPEDVGVVTIAVACRPRVHKAGAYAGMVVLRTGARAAAKLYTETSLY